MTRRWINSRLVEVRARGPFAYAPAIKYKAENTRKDTSERPTRHRRLRNDFFSVKMLPLVCDQLKITREKVSRRSSITASKLHPFGSSEEKKNFAPLWVANVSQCGLIATLGYDCGDFMNENNSVWHVLKFEDFLISFTWK